MKKKKINLYSVGWFLTFSFIFSAVLTFLHYMMPVFINKQPVINVFNYILPYSFVGMIIFLCCYFLWAIVEFYVMTQKEKKSGFF